MQEPRKVRLPEYKGQLYLHSMPGRFEPLAGFTSWLGNAQVQHVFCLAPRTEIRVKSPDYAKAIESGTFPAAMREIPIEDYSVPEPDVGFEDGVRTAAELIRTGENVLVHCAGGIGRTGTFAACLLQELGLSHDESLRRVREVDAAPERPGQVRLVKEYMSLSAS